MKVQVKKTISKGWGLFAKARIKPGEIIAYYRVYVCLAKDATDLTYAVSIYSDKTGRPSRKYIAIPNPTNTSTVYYKGYACWGHLVNEPDSHQTANAWVEYQPTTLKTVDVGQVLYYRVRALKHIPRADEITVDYGRWYRRDYKCQRRPTQT